MVEVIAEVGSVHDGSFGNALKLIEVSKKCGADTVKFQMHIAEAETTKNAPSPSYFSDESRYEYFSRTAFSEEKWFQIYNYCKAKSIKFLCSPFSIVAAERLHKMGCNEVKIASGEVSNLPLLEYVNKKFRKIYLSSGMSSLEEISSAVSILKDSEICLMQCTSMYPCDTKNVGLNVIKEFYRLFPNLQIGFSDHFDGIEAGVAAVVTGAQVVEKHITFSREMYGSDASLALEPSHFAQYVSSIRNVNEMLSNPVNKVEVAHFQNMKDIFEKSIYVSKTLAAGQIIEIEDLKFLKPGDGIKASEYKSVLGRVCKTEILEDTQLDWKNLI